MCMIDDCDPVTPLTTREPKARKAHTCSECRRTIQPGERYRYQSFLMEGDLDEHKLCDRCAIPVAWLRKNCGGYVYGMVHEEIVEHARDYPQIGMPLARIAIGMKRKWKSFSGDGLMPIPKQAPDIFVAEHQH